MGKIYIDARIQSGILDLFETIVSSVQHDRHANSLDTIYRLRGQANYYEPD
jgi:hypothetical protein